MGRRRYVAAAVLAGALLLASCHSPSTPPPPPPTSGPTPGVVAPAPQAASVREIAKNMAAIGWTQQGQLVYNRRGSDGEWDAYTARPDLSGERCVTCSLNVPGPGTKGQRGGSAVSPDGKYLLASIEGEHGGRYGGSESDPGKGRYDDIWLIQLNGGGAWRLTNYAADGDLGTIWAGFDRSGNRIVWSQMHGGTSLRAPFGSWRIKMARLSWSAGRARLTDVQTREPQEHRFYEPYGYSPDGRSILLASDYKMPSVYNAQIFLMDVRTGAMKRMSPADAPTGFFTNYNEFAEYTPDGTRIVFGRTKSAHGGMDYWTMRADGSDVRRLTYTGAPWHTGSQRGYGHVGGFTFDRGNPNRIFATRSTDLTSHNLQGIFIDLTSGGLRATYYKDRDLRTMTSLTAENPSDGLSFAKDTSVRWTGRLQMPTSGKYTFSGRTDGKSALHITIDGVRLQPKREFLKPAGTYSATVDLQAGEHSVTIEYVNGGDDGYEQVVWQPPGTQSATEIPITAYS
jgi:hypothetical protein